MKDFLEFRRMITPVVIQVIFLVAVIFIVVGGVINIADGRAGRGALALILGPLAARVYCEVVIVIFRINDTLTDIWKSIAAKTPGGEPAGQA